MDQFKPEKRSDIMRRVKAKDTGLEMRVRSVIHKAGFRFRLHRKDLPGKPDLIFPKYRKVIFIHGCFWHGHDCKRGNRGPKTNVSYWLQKIEKNKERDARNMKELAILGWGVAVLWECECKVDEVIIGKVKSFLLSS